MASLSSVSSSSNTVSSLMNSANMISGLASGLDTESMIESLVQSYSTKINQLNQKVTKVEWKQDAYRSIISKMVGFSNKYTSYTSSTNLMSSSFFSNAVKVLTKGDYADSVTASGKTGSDIQLNAVHQLAESARYRTKSNLMAGEVGYIRADKGVDLSFDAEAGAENGGVTLSNLQGSLSLKYGSKTVSISFNETTDVDTVNDIRAKLESESDTGYVSDSEVLAELINQKLADQTIVFNSGNSESADQRIKATANGDTITFSELGTGKNGVYISKASGNLAEQLGLSEDDLENAAETKPVSLDTSNMMDAKGNKGLTRDLNAFEYLAEKSGTTMNMNLDGTTKQITMPRVGYAETEDGGEKYYLNGEEVEKDKLVEEYTKALQKSVEDAFGDKVTVKNLDTSNKTLQLEFKVKNEGSNLLINTGVGDALGIGNTATSYLNTSKTLKDLMGDKLNTLSPATKKDEYGVQVLDIDEKTGKQKYEFVLNGQVIGKYTEDAKLSDIMADINSNKDAGVQVSYSQTTQNFTFTAKETGVDSKIEIGEGLAQAMFGSTEPEDYSGNRFGDSYGASWLDGDKVNFRIPGTGGTYSFGVSKDATVEDVANELTDLLSQNHGITASYDKYSGELKMYDKNGAEVDFDMWVEDSLVGRIDLKLEDEYRPTTNYTPGKDAKFTVTVNGETLNMTRSSNSVNIDGLNITMNETFDATVDENGNKLSASEIARKSVTFQNKTDSDKIIDAIKSMVNDYNTMMSEIKSAYSTMPYQKSDGSFANYEPLTDEEREGMSESAIERYEEKAKQGILFGDRNLSNLYTKMNQAFSFANQDDVNTLKDMGISVSYNISGGEQAVTIDEDKLRAMLDSDPDRVADLFTKTDGIMDRMKTQLDAYAKTTGEPKGILIQQAGSPLSSLSLMSNQWQTEIDNYNTQIEKWQDKLASQVERYTSQFSRLELLIQQMNSQSSTLAGMMGG